MKQHFVHFNRRDIRLRFPIDPEDPWFSELQDKADGFDQPRYHVTRAIDGPAAEVESEATIWLVGQLYAPWGEQFPPTLDARVDVAEVNERNGKPGFRYAAADTSRWFDLTPATEQLRALQCTPRENGPLTLWKDPKRPIGHYLRRMRKLASGEILQAWEREQASRPLHFVSYRLRDGSRPAFSCARQLFQEGKRVFWDRWCLPRRLAERREAVGDQPLDATIEARIREADVVWGVESPLYMDENCYAARERELAQSLGKYRSFAVS
ncbi:MAG: hypothetical protein AAFN78_19115 [Pseudomonadota bacterium]